MQASKILCFSSLFTSPTSKLVGMTMRLMHTSLDVGLVKRELKQRSWRLAYSEWANHTGEGQTNPTSYGELADGLFGPRGD
ncbi:hypothetical protein CDL15_Pgr024662 [Punica granatum]|uniref:Uncharacterized protein n=1 Tax=Punica granatum TaxID=22663 RepID=A0A218WUC7_PUNGR|nr:hypothetical protein CDL15_Pgr024662 [Punica granatum]PKI38027.1 hypothetical protein CRG98_041581 [Punica granatum]